jgi:putative peptidoglycan lipid II flippase
MDARLLSKLPRLLAACVIMAAALWGAREVLWPLAQGQIMAILMLAALVAIGLAAFGVSAQVLGAARLSDIKGMMRRK